MKARLIQSQDLLPDGTTRIYLQVSKKNEVKEIPLIKCNCKPHEFVNQRLAKTVENYEFTNSLLKTFIAMARMIIDLAEINGEELTLEEFTNRFGEGSKDDTFESLLEE